MAANHQSSLILVNKKMSNIEHQYRKWAFFTFDLNKPLNPSRLMTVNISETKVIFQTIRDMDFSFFAEKEKIYELGLFAFKIVPSETPHQTQTRFSYFLYDKLESSSLIEVLRDNHELLRLVNTARFSIEDYAEKYKYSIRGKLEGGTLELNSECHLRFDCYRETDKFKWVMSLPMFEMSIEKINTFF
jgi:hypothetical protein